MSEEQRQTGITRSWSQRSPERDELDGTLVRRFVEASRRAEIMALVNSAGSATDLGATVTTELCEAFEAEIAFVMAARADGSPPILVGLVGMDERAGARLLHDPVCMAAIADTEPAAHSVRDLAGAGIRSVALAPGAIGNERVLVGVARLYDQPFDAAELALLEGVASSATHALERAWLSAEREVTLNRQSALARAAKALGQSLEPERVLSTLCAEVARATGGEIVVVYFGDAESGLRAVAGHGVPEGFVGYRRAPGEGLGGQAVATGVLQLSNDYRGDGLNPESTSALDGVRAGMSAPLRRRGTVDGAVSVGFLEPRWLSEDDLELLGAFAELAAVACRNADEHAAARVAAARDSLTGCLNHATFHERLREEIARADRGADPFTLVMLDLEDFKAVNEAHGHLSGDAVLRGVGDVLRNGVRAQDVVARFGGDEFALILPETDEESAEPLVGRLLGQLRGVSVPGGRSLGAHAGLAQWQPGEGPIAVVERADHALRVGKRHRRGEEQATGRQPEPDRGAAQQHERLAGRRRRRLAVAARIGAKLSRLLDVDAIADTTARELTSTLHYEFAALMRLSGDGLVKAAGTGPAGTPRLPAWSWAQPQDEGAIGRCLRERRPVLIDDAKRDPVSSSWPELRMRSELAVPVHVDTELWGAIELQAAEPAEFDEEDARLVELVADHAGAALRTAELYRKLEQTHLGVAEALAAALEAKDGYTANHARWIAELAVELAREMKVPEALVSDVRYGAIFHDIGKIAVPDAILNKPGPLTAEEFAVIKRHPLVGEQILAPVPFLSDVRRIVRHDHERWDGSGYPDGLRGRQIPVGARIVFVVDSYHAMISDRPYRSAMSETEARAELRTGAGGQFDPEVVDVFLGVLDRRA